jgi:hypothetical protein
MESINHDFDIQVIVVVWLDKREKKKSGLTYSY